MLILVHENTKKVVRIIRNDSELSIHSASVVEEFWRLAKDYPEDLIIWVDRQFFENLNIGGLDKIFHHNLIMASYPVKNQFLPDTIGYIDQLPFINPKYEVSYPTWQMSTDVGGITGKAALAFKDHLGKIDNFGYLINSIAKIGQQNSLFCYSDPLLLNNITLPKKLNYLASDINLFKFVYQYYKTEWILVLFFCHVKYDLKIPFWSLITCFFSDKNYLKKVDLSEIKVNSSKFLRAEKETVDVIIPTLDRPEYLKQVLLDLKKQSLIPKRVIIVEQDPDPNSESQLSEINDLDWPFEIVHRFVHKTGACMARNTGMLEVKSNWVFFADDDIRITPDVLENAFSEINRLGIYTLNLNCVQPEGKTVFHKIKQWGAFGSGTAIVASEYALQCRFSEIYEYGFGEDTDFGLQLRAKGADIIYHPDIQITHLKAERGGFRGMHEMPWEKLVLVPKPSPTMMSLVTCHFNIWMQRGYKVSLFLKFYNNQPIKNPISYLRSMNKRWKLSEEWAKKISLKTSEV